MLSTFNFLKKKATPLLMAVLFLATQVTSTVAISLLASPKAVAAPVCVNDTAGANDEPGQKDLTKLCVDYANVPTTIATTWNWDDLGTNGANTLDACNLFDTDGDGNINYAVCVTTTGTPAALQTTTTYSCGDAKIDRCTSTAAVISNGTTTCSVSQQSTDPFATGNATPKDTEGKCTVQLSAVGGSTAKLVDVCSYPSSQPNSDPSDCVVTRSNAGKLEVIKNLIPVSDAGLFNLQIDSVTKAANVGNNGTTAEQVIAAGTHTVGETAGTSTSLAGYSSAIVCKDLNGTGSIVAQGTGTSLSLNLADQADVVCVITNTASASITIIKNAVPNDAQDFAFTTTGTGLSNFTLDDDAGASGANATYSNTKTFSGLAAGTYSVTEPATAGWDLRNINCGSDTAAVINGNTVNFTLTAGRNVTCTYENAKRGQIIVTKQTLPDGDPTSFSITASKISGSGTIAGNATRSITDNNSVTYDVSQGEYSVSEDTTNGWSKDDSACQNLVLNTTSPVVNGIPTLTCTITNTKLATLTIVKDALPNDAQDFGFTKNFGSPSFSLDDDSDNTLPNQQVFSNLTPGQTYSVTEQATGGWALTGLSCGNVAQQGSTASVTPTAGQSITCTFTNTKYGSIGGFKYEVNADGTVVGSLTDWTINLLLDGNQYASTSTLADGSYSFGDLLPGNYTIQELQQSGYTQITPTAPGTISETLTAGETSTDNNFGNFQNASISGLKFNDHNGNGVRDQYDENLTGWTIKLYKDPDLVTAVQTDVTDVNGYSFTDIAPGTYWVCETAQTGWVQTYPGNNACHQILIDQSGETNSSINFGNQGRGSIQVLKNVDTDGDGKVDQTSATDWTWDIDGSGDNATGSTQPVAAGTYQINEDQKTDFHFVSVSCEGQRVVQSETISVSVQPGDNIVCTYTNARDAGTLKVIKNVINDNGGKASASDFNLYVKQNDTNVAGSPAAGSAIGTVYALPTGQYAVSEEAPVEGYANTSIVCDGQETASVTVKTDSEVVCTITNDDIAPELNVIKHVINDNSGKNVASDFEMQVTGTNVAPSASFDGSETGTKVTLNAGTYNVGESGPDGYAASKSADCSGTISLGEKKTCTITNDDTAHPNIQVTKSGPNYAHEGDVITYSFAVDNIGDEPLTDVTVTDLLVVNVTYVSGDTNNNQILDTDEVWQFTADYTVPAAQTADIVNTAEACGEPRVGDEVCDTDDHTVDVIHPAITVVKSGPTYGYEGQTIGYSFLVTNIGDTTLYNVGVSDDIASGESCLKTELAPSESTTCSAMYIIPTPTSDNVINTVIASGTDTLGETVTSQDDHTLDVIHPGIHVVKTGPETAYEGDKVTYTFYVTNKGDIPLAEVTVKDDIAGDAAYVSGDTNGDEYLDSGEVWIYAADYVIPHDQTENVKNTVQACGSDPKESKTCDTDNHELDVLHPSIKVEKFGPATAYEGDTVTYTFTVTNTGDTKLVNVGIDDNIATGEVCDTDTLEIGETTNCSASYTVPTPQTADVVNTVTAKGTDPNGKVVDDTDDHTLDVLHPTITIIKQVVSSSDIGDDSFDLQIDGKTVKQDAVDGSTSGAVVVTPGQHSIGEVAGNESTDLSDYTSTFGENCLEGTVSVSGDDNVTCTITNTKKASIVVNKDAVPNDAQDFNFTITPYNPENEVELSNIALSDVLDISGTPSKQFTLDDDGNDNNGTSSTNTANQLTPGWYEVTEDQTTGWDLIDITCNDQPIRELKTIDTSVNATRLVYVGAGDQVTCTFTNQKRGSITIIKDARPDDGQEFNFSNNFDGEESSDFTLTDDGENSEAAQKSFGNVIPGEYYFEETPLYGWELKSITCNNEEYGDFRELSINEQNNGHWLYVNPGEDVTCTVVNKAIEPTVTIVKKVINDDGNDQVTSDFKYDLSQGGVKTSKPFAFDPSSPYESGEVATLSPGDYSVNEQTATGYATTYSEGCTGEVSWGDEVICVVTNDDNPPVINISKSNNKPEPTVVGDTVKYTLKVWVPETSGIVYNALVTDLPPDNFEYIHGSYSASSSLRGDLKSAGITTEPTYHSPGNWILGDMMPGETVTLTYNAKISSNVTPGIYPDIAFVRGYAAENAEAPEVLGNLSYATTPFVGTDVEIGAPVPVPAEVLVNTGGYVPPILAFIPALMLGLTVLAYRRSRKYDLKGGQR